MNDNNLYKFESEPALTLERAVELIEGTDSDEEKMQVLLKYTDQCHADADAEATSDPDSEVVSNGANLKAEIRIGELCVRTKKYREVGIASLEDVYIAARQNESTLDLAQQIDEILKNLS